MENFGIKLKELRLNKDESQKDLADALNISFQSVSKWEQGIHYPDVFLLQQIANHYNIDVNYFFENHEQSKKVERRILKPVFNQNGEVVVWTDFTYNESIAPVSILDEARHRAGNGFLKTHPGPKDYLIIAVDKNSKICFIGEHCNYRIPSCGPESNFYASINNHGKNNECFIFEENYKGKENYQSFGNGYGKNFEFVIPKGGFLINIPDSIIDAKNILTFLFPDRLKGWIDRNYPNLFLDKNRRMAYRSRLFDNELDNCIVYLENDHLVFEKNIINNSFTGYKPSDLEKLVLELKESIEELEDRVEELENRIDIIDELESRIEDLEDEIE